jgi:hypothetical protein
MAKRARERARKAKQDAKRERRHSASTVDPSDGPDTDALMEEFRLLSESHAAGNIAQDAYDQERQRIFEELGLDTQ